MGSILDPADLTERLAQLLRTVGAVMPGDASHLALAVGIDPLGMLSEGKVTGVSRSRMSPRLGSGNQRLAALAGPDRHPGRPQPRSSRDAGRSLTDALLTALRSRKGGGWF